MSVQSFGQVIPVLGQNNGFPGTITRLGSHRTISARQVLPTTTNNLLFGAVAILIPDSEGGKFQPVADFIAAGSQSVVTTGNTTGGSKTIIVASIAGIAPGDAVTGTGVAANSVVTGASMVNGVPTITVNNNAASTQVGTVLTFSNPTANIGMIYGGAVGGAYMNAPRFAGIAVREVKTQLTYPIGVTPGSSFQTGYYAPGEMAEVLEDGSICVLITNGFPTAGLPVYLRVLANNGIPGTSVGDLEAVDDPVATTTATMAAGNKVITVVSATGIANGQIVTGGSIPAGTCVTNVSGTSITLSAAPTGDADVATAVSFSNMLQLPDVTFRTGVLDANNVAEITLLNRRAA